MKNSKKIPFNLFFIAGIFILAVVYFFGSLEYDFGTLKFPGAGFLPRIIGICSMVLSAGLFVYDVHKNNREEANFDFPFNIFLFVICFIIYVLIFKPLGYVISTVIFAFAMAMIMRNKLWVSTAIAVGTGISFYIIFSLLAVPLPKGILG